MANFWFATCILATWAVVAVDSSWHQLSAPLMSPETAETMAPTPAIDCSSLIYNMADCLSFLSDGSDETTPDNLCCSGFKLVMDTDPDCICEALKSSSNLGVELNMTKAITLPSACAISAPSLGSCSLSMSPGSPPDSTPVVDPPPATAPPPEAQNPPPATIPPPEDQNPPPATAPPPEAQNPPPATVPPSEGQNPPPTSVPPSESQNPPPASVPPSEAQNPPPKSAPPALVPSPASSPTASDITKGGANSPAPSPANSGSSYTTPISFPVVFSIVVASLLYILV